ncbi:MAG: hypothetical protein V4628_15500, partial [Pseudomonadota bacterium]
MFNKAPNTLFLVLLLTSAVVQATEAPVAKEQTDVAALRAETRQLEQNMYNLFNKFNSNDDLDVACGDKAVTGSTIPVWQCDAAFMRDAGAQDVGRRFDNNYSRDSAFGNAPQSTKQLSFSLREKTQQLN